MPYIPMQIIHTQRGKSLFTVKQNQPTLYADLATSLPDPHASCQQAETWDRSRGRVEHRLIRASQEMNLYLAPHWPLIRHIAEVTRTVTQQGETSSEVVYLITDLSPRPSAS